MLYLSKFDFMLARSCAKKLVYTKAGYDSSMEGNADAQPFSYFDLSFKI